MFDLAAHNITGVPDGMTIDADDNLWVAVYAGGMVSTKPIWRFLGSRVFLQVEVFLGSHLLESNTFLY